MQEQILKLKQFTDSVINDSRITETIGVIHEINILHHSSHHFSPDTYPDNLGRIFMLQ